ncbi:MAG: DNA mismatch repair endonuclease MutL [Phycisphaerales bacterium]|nr:DNA mismatch repair endonuclease MutL [Phycisphaerales bacterium]
MPIRVLSPLLVNQIAAGEVVERPASVVKELVENAVDAGAGRIEVSIENGGLDLIQVADDGTGIRADELALAVASHATSKIADPGDLEAISTMGFRGEALASIASVSRLRLLSRPHDVPEGAQIEVEGGTLRPVRPASAAPGTTVLVRTLFFNTPARRKFLRSARAEAGRVSEVVEAIAMAHPAVGFRLEVDGRATIDLPAGQDRRARVVEILGRGLEPELLEIGDETGGEVLAMWGLVGLPRIAKATSKHVRLFLNGRFVTDRTVLHALRESYRGLVEPHRSPVAALFLRVDPHDVDVNVHPAKSEVRFRNPSMIHGLVHRTVLRRLRQADLVPELDLARMGGATPDPKLGGASLGAPSQRSEGHAGPSWTWSGSSAARGPTAPASWSGFDLDAAREVMAGSAPTGPASAEALPTIRFAPEVMQVQRRYLVTQDEHGIVVIDQHALHERVMFERLRERIERGPLESQRLLVPATAEVDAGASEAIDALEPLLMRLGIEATPLGPRTVAVHAFPSLLFERGVEPAPFVQELLTRAADEGLPHEPEAALAEVLDMMACKAAIKSGDRLSESELAELLALRETVERATNCPHGRPTSLRLTVRDLDRQFGRS